MQADEAVEDLQAIVHRRGLRHLPVVLIDHTVSPYRNVPAPGWMHRRRIARFEIGCVAAYHLGVAFTLLAAPREQVVTPGTSVIFGIIPLPVWAAWFALTGLAAAAAVHRSTPLRMSLTWIGTFPLGASWVAGFIMAVSNGHGNAIFALTWCFLLLWWLTLAYRMFVGGSGNRWDGI